MRGISLTQAQRLLEVALFCTFLLFACEIIFSIEVIVDWLSGLVTKAGAWTWVVVWVLLFIQVIIPIPAYVVIFAVLSIMPGQNWILLAVAISAYMVGIIIAYWIGRKWGRIAVKWCAGSDEEYDKWANFINKKGKFIYFLTVLFPIFPDDILCFVCGSVKFNFGYFMLFNFVGRTIGLITTMFFLDMLSGGGSLTTIAWGVALLAEIIVWIILEIKNKKQDKTLQIQEYISKDKEGE